MERQVHVAGLPGDQEQSRPESSRGKAYFSVSGRAVAPSGAGHRCLLSAGLGTAHFGI